MASWQSVAGGTKMGGTGKGEVKGGVLADDDYIFRIRADGPGTIAIAPAPPLPE